MAQGTFDLWQQTFTLSMMANAAFNVDGRSIGVSLAKYMESSINDRFATPELQKLIGDSWELAWGPCVFQEKSDSHFADNAMFVAHDTINRIYVVAIAATNVDSPLDLIQDLNVKPISWPYGGSAPNGTKISTGTRAGVNVLLGMQSQGQTLLSYLLTRADTSSSTLIFTGHSLGGALSSTLALALTGKGLKLREWEAVHVYPTAGPTPGNPTFASYFSQTFPQSATGPQPWQVWNADLANSLDVVPCAWNEKTLSRIPNLYTPNITADKAVVALVLAAQAAVILFPYARLGTASGLTGSSVQGSGNSFIDFMTEAGYQHIKAYFGLLGVDALRPIFQKPNTFAPMPPAMASV